MTAVIDRLRLWRDLMRADYTTEEPDVEAGRAAEELLRTLVKTNLKYKGAYCFLGKRVPSQRHQRRFEIDLVVLTKKHLHFIEVKNWSGDLSKVGAKWIQTRRSGEQVEHPNLAQYNSEKCDVVVEYLQARGVNLDATYFAQKTIFMNPRLRIAPAIAQHPAVVTPHRLGEYLATQRGSSFAERLVHSVVELCLDSDKSSVILDGLFHAMSSNSFATARESLSALETWDKVVLHGGRVLSGDALKLFVGSETVDIKALPSGSRCPVRWNRSKVLGLVQSLFFSYPIGHIHLSGRIVAVKPNDILKFHAAGDEKPSELPMRNINMVLRG